MTPLPIIHCFAFVEVCRKVVCPLSPGVHRRIAKAASGRHRRRLDLPITDDREGIQTMNEPQMLDQVILPAENMSLVAGVAQTVAMHLQVLGCWIKHVTVGAVIPSRRLRYDGTPVRRANPFLKTKMQARFVARPVVLGPERVAAECALERAAFLVRVSHRLSPP